MTTGGIVIMTISWIFILGLTIFCMKKVLSLRDTEAEHIKTVYDIDTGDQDEEKKPES